MNPSVQQHVVDTTLLSVECRTCSRTLDHGEKYVIVNITGGLSIRVCRWCTAQINNVAQRTDLGERRAARKP